MEIPASHQNTNLPLSWRLRRAALIALLLGLWAPCKIMWEQSINRQQNQMRYNSSSGMAFHLRDQLGQGVSLAVLGGMSNVVADFIFVINVTVAWEDADWIGMAKYITLVTTLQPRAPIFWDMGGWHLAYNASVSAMQDVHAQPNELRRLKASRYWIERGLDVYLRGIDNNPQDWKLMRDTAGVYQQRLKDYNSAATYYKMASEAPDAPIYLERFPAIMYHFGGDDKRSYEEWTDLWNRLTPAQREEPRHFAGKNNAAVLRQIEQKLSIPREKRVFPN